MMVMRLRVRIAGQALDVAHVVYHPPHMGRNAQSMHHTLTVESEKIIMVGVDGSEFVPSLHCIIF
jgi:hypothetical protein